MASIGTGMTVGADLRIDDWADWWASVSQRGVLIELAVIVACALLAWGLAIGARRAWPFTADKPSILNGARGFDGALFPILWLGLAYIAQLQLSRWQPVPFFRVALPALVALAIIRLGAKALEAAFPKASSVRTLERSISWLVWLCFVMWVTGILPLMMHELDQVTWQVGGAKLSIATLFRGVITVGVVVMLALWASGVIESRLLRSASG